jgi:hypothetical protein
MTSDKDKDRNQLPAEILTLVEAIAKMLAREHHEADIAERNRGLAQKKEVMP